MNDATISVLLVEDDPADAQLIQAALADPPDGARRDNRFRVEWVSNLSLALQALGRSTTIEVVLLDLSLPDSQGIEAYDRIAVAAPNALVLVLSGVEDEDTWREAITRGAHDYFSKAHIDAHWLPRALCYVIDRKNARAELSSSETRFRAMSDASPLGILLSDADGNCSYVNAAWESIAGRRAEQILGQHWSSAIHPEDRSRAIAEWQAALHGKEFFQTEVRYLRHCDGDADTGNADGDGVVWARINAAAMRGGKPLRSHVQTVEDITQRKEHERGLAMAEEALFDEKERAQVTLNSIGDAVLCTDMQGRVTYLNAVAESMTGWSRDEAVGQPFCEVFRVIDGATRESVDDPVHRAIHEDRTVALAIDSLLVRRDGYESAIEDSAAPIHNRAGDVTGAVIVFHDVSQSRAMATRMTHLAQHDFLTGLPNRVLLTERLSQAIGLAKRHDKQVALLFLDLDHFKHVNDSLGHAIGDRLLQSVGERLTSCTRATDTVCRLGGDEFVILLPEIEHPQDAGRVAEALGAAFLAPHLIDDHEMYVTLSIGIAIHPDDGINAVDLMQNADTAMYHAKGGGRNTYQFFRAEMNTRAVRRQFLESSMRRALKHNEFVLHYQPKVNIDSGEVIGAEALIRWQDPEQGMIYPLQFVPVAEECGLMIPIGQWVLREACRQVKAWQDAGLVAVPVAVNISAMEFRHKRFLECLAEILDETGLAPCYLELELTETILMQDAESSVPVLEALKRMGVQLAVDDFGTGYSSLSYLKRFPVDVLKIDQSFVRDITTGVGDAILVSAVIGMGRSLRYRVVAEGVETVEQLAFLRDQHCDDGQGFLFGYPLPAAEFSPALATQGARHITVVA